VLVAVLGARSALAVAGFGPVIAGLLGLAALRASGQRAQHAQRRLAPRLEPVANDA
jgi:hypothetical protein